MLLPETASQTAGPYVHIGCLPASAGLEGRFAGPPLGAAMIAEGVTGERIAVEGRVLDATGAPLRDAMVEVWQADAQGLYPGMEGADPHLAGWARRATDPETGVWRLDTVRPGAVAHAAGRMAPHLTLWIVARGINLGLHTRLLFDGAPENEACPVLARIDPPARRATLMAREAQGAWRHDVRLAGEGETVFFDV